MLLIIDAGNTRIKWAVAESDAKPGVWSTFGSVAHEQLDQLESVWRLLDVTSVIASNVAGAALQGRLASMLFCASDNAALPIQWFASSSANARLRNGYRQPQQLGSDRFASAIGARVRYPDQALLIATCGTATTIDGVSADGIFTGGMILPGLKLMASSLARNTAQLPEVLAQGERLPLFADNTEEAIISGCISAQVGAIERAYAGFARLYPDEAIQCIVSGGAGSLIALHLAVPCVHADNLVLLGLHAVAQTPQSTTQTGSC
jgi:type III pantothenate kinase